MDCYRCRMRQSAGAEVRRASQRSWIALLGGLGLVSVAVLASLTGVVPDILTTVAAVVGVGGMIYGVATAFLSLSTASPMSDRDRNRGMVLIV